MDFEQDVIGSAQNAGIPASQLPPPGLPKNQSFSAAREGDFEDSRNPEGEAINSAQNGPLESRRQAKSALRLKYEAEINVIERKLGDLESIRQKLGLSQRKMAQLLLVDPSAWTRWTKGGDDAPPHVYRMLQWYLALEEKYPALDVKFWLQTVAQLPDQTNELAKAHREASVDLSRQLGEANQRIAKLEREVEPARIVNLKMLLLFTLGLLVGAAVVWFR